MAYISDSDNEVEKSSEDVISGSETKSLLRNVISDSEDDDICRPKDISLNPEVSSDSEEECVDKLGSENLKPKNVIQSDSGNDSDEQFNMKSTPKTSDSKQKLEIISAKNSKTSTVKQKKKQKHIISSNSEDDLDEEQYVKTIPINSNVIAFDSEDELNDDIYEKKHIRKEKYKTRNVIGSDSEVDTDEIGNISTKLGRSRISQDFKGKELLCSTFIDTKTSSTPVNKETGKRLLNKSVDTPRVFKQVKEASTPRLENQKPHEKDYVTPKSFKNPEGYTPRQTTIVDLSSSDDEDIIDISEDDSDNKSQQKYKSVKRPNFSEALKKDNPEETAQTSSNSNSEFVEISPRRYQEQSEKVRKLQSDLQNTQRLIKTINLQHLPDQGHSLIRRQSELETKQMEEVVKLSKMKVTLKNENPPARNNQARSNVLWKDLEAGATRVQPKTLGQKAMLTHNAQKALTIDRLQQLHGSLENCPKETEFSEPPKGLKIELMPHQRRALSWLMWRENEKPSGGILADDMGLGKTLTMISLMLKSNESEQSGDSDDDEENTEAEPGGKHNGGTIVVCPASLINQWTSELTNRTKRGLASYLIYHGPKRETKPKRLAKYDMVVTTYSIVNNECDKNGAIFRVKWRRIVIDEAHQIRNHKTQTSEAVCKLSAKSRWALTGTPVHNKELDMYALLKYLRCTPFDDLAVWKRWVSDKSTGGTERLHMVISSLMLRRTKAELIEKGTLNNLPERKWEVISVDLTKSERDVYNKILIFSRTLFAQFLHQRADKNQDNLDFDTPSLKPNEEYFLMRNKLLKFNKLREIKQHEILVLLLRLRQVCNHPTLITGMFNEDIELMGGETEGEALDFLEQLNNLAISDSDAPTTSAAGVDYGKEAATLKEVVRNVLSPSDPVFSKTTISSKIKAVIHILTEKVLNNNDKGVIISQWPTFLELIALHLRNNSIKYDQLDGKVPVAKRMDMIDRFNNPNDKMKVLLLSLTAGGVGLNLVGANHLMLLDLHWNPQLENQAQDRIYRVGQLKPVFIYKFMAADTIEKRILDLQEKKLDIANSMLTGTVQASKNKLSMADLKLLFEM